MDSHTKQQEGATGQTGPRTTVGVDLNTSQMSTASKSGLGKNRKPRTKGLLRKLQEQVEFYFGDANLPKDKFLQQKMSENPDSFVAVDVIASFKKMQSLSKDMTLVLKAIKNSPLLKLSDDSLCVKRATPLPDMSSSQVDARTVYVENLTPETTTHDSVKKMFSVFGKVLYVSLPKHKVSGDIKGFAFVEFSTEDETRTALEYFKDKLETQTSKEDTQTSKENIQTSKEDTQTSKEDTQTSKEDIQISKEGTQVALDGTVGTSQLKQNDSATRPGTDQATPTRRKRKREEDNQGTQLPEDTKKFRPDSTTPTTSNDPDSTSKHSDTLPDEKQTTDNDSSGAVSTTSVTVVGIEAIQEGTDPATKKQNTKPLRAEQSTREECQKTDDVVQSVNIDDGKQGGTRLEDTGQQETRKRKRPSTDDRLPSPKSTRLDSQTSETDDLEGMSEGGGADMSMSEGKKKKKKNRQHKKKSRGSVLKDLGLRVMSKAEWISMKQMYKDLQKQHMKQLKEETKSPQEGVKEIRSKGFVSQCLLKVDYQGDTVADVDELQAICSAYGEVAYYDLQNGDKEGYVRYKTSGCVTKLLETEQPHTAIKFSAVEDVEERAYFLKTQAERKQRYLKSHKRNRRGQDRLISKVLKGQELRSREPKKRVPPVELTMTKAPSAITVKTKSTHIKFDSDSEESIEQ